MGEWGGKKRFRIQINLENAWSKEVKYVSLTQRYLKTKTQNVKRERVYSACV